ncbi:S-layer homology domain-containing protein [Propionibacterium freudenreichii]|uniref:S-layer homology domain-containing protein n=2 Tax=Propionibacterium freudenreichii TaxID=1744 RepID=UPI000A695276|nr:S-layer homology domain-containing protein [Propionibacterium freudenreichii]WGU90754.1 S-layer homology domain-containing protein [Propionibacterium freudenreichii]SCQ70853.1 S-layer protein, SHL domain protein [Propionibacterium freudenreichii]SCQ79623.1 S-layer protein, SHL domain protein [Propionibacterium freudenreichii]
MTDKNKGQETSKTAILTVAEAAELITAQPKSVTVQEGSPASFTVTAGGDNLTYQWQAKGNDGTWQDVAGATKATLSVSQATKELNGSQYQVVVKSGDKSETSSVVTLTVTDKAVTQFFADVPLNNQFFTEINWMGTSGYSTGWVQADGSRLYMPLDGIHRDAFAAFMYRISGDTGYQAPAVSPFRDITPSTMYYKEMCWLSSKGIATGWPDGTYRPLDNVNRDAMAAFMYRYNGSPAYQAPGSSPFSDVVTSQLFYKEMAWMQSQGLSTGWPDGTYRPVTAIARDAMAAFLYRMENPTK